MQLLLENGANPNTEDDEKRTPLIWSIKNDNLNIARDLFANGAKFDATIYKPLHLAVYYGNESFQLIFPVLIDFYSTF